MLAQRFETFSKIIKDLEIECSDTAIRRAIKMASFKQLKKAEQKQGFKEKNVRSSHFFRSDKSNQFETELSTEQIQQIIKKHKTMMKKKKYLS